MDTKLIANVVISTKGIRVCGLSMPKKISIRTEIPNAIKPLNPRSLKGSKVKIENFFIYY
jgi:hypothetical protein